MDYLYASDENYLRHAAASMVSLCEHQPAGAQVHIHLLDTGAKPESIAQLKALVAGYGRELTVWPLGDLRHWFDFEIFAGGFTVSAMGRLLAGRVLPEEVHRVLYLDCDTIVLDDLSPLETLDMQGCPVGMVQEPTVSHKRLPVLGLPETSRYCNSGVLLMDLDRWRAEETEKAIFDYYRAKGAQLIAPDQDALNGALPGHIYILPPRYNFGSVQIYYGYAAQKKMCAPAPFYAAKADYEAAAFPPAIVHFLGEERPWRAGNRHPYRKAYEEALAKTPWKNAPQEQGWQTYFRCFGLFNAVTKPFPLLRWRIINSLIPAFMRMREKKRVKANGK